MNNKPNLLLYCQHSLGLGHWVRAMTLAKALAKSFRVTLLNGGKAPGQEEAVEDLHILNLPPLGMGDNHQLYSQDALYTLADALALRKELILQSFETIKPTVILIELFPFGRKKLAGEILPLLKAARRQKPVRPLVLCSLRDIMVNARKDQARHDERARWLSDRYFDRILVHADPRFVRLEDSFSPKNPLQTPISYTGFVMPDKGHFSLPGQAAGIIVSAGGGMVGAPLFRAAIHAHQKLWAAKRLTMTLVAGPFLPEADWQDLQAECVGKQGLTLIRSVQSMQPLLRAHQYSVSQCGYNTVMELIESGIKAVVVPFVRGQEDEQSQRAAKLADTGIVKVLDPAMLSAEKLADAILALENFSPRPSGLDLAGAGQTVQLIEDFLQVVKITEIADAKGAAINA